MPKTLLIAVCLFIFACKKENFVYSPELEGKWKLYDTYFSAGGPLIYAKADKDNNDYLEFKTDGSLSDSENRYSSYRMKDSTSLIFTKKNKAEETYLFNIKEGLLNLQRIDGPICIEGCGVRYKKESE